VRLAEGEDLLPVAADERRRRQAGELGDEQLLRRVPHMGRVVHHERLRVDAIEDVRGGDVAHVEGRVLAEQHHVEGREVHRFRWPEREVIALLVADRDGLDPRLDAPVPQGKPVRRVVVEGVTPPLAFEHQGEGRVAPDVEARNMVHLDGDLERHFSAGSPCWPALYQGHRRERQWSPVISRRVADGTICRWIQTRNFSARRVSA